MQLLFDVLHQITAAAAAFWVLLGSFATAVANVWYSLRQIHTIGHLSDMTWGDLGRTLTTIPWTDIYGGTVVSLRFLVGLASVVSAITTIIGVRYYFRRTNEHALTEKFNAMLQIYSLAVDLQGEIDELQNADGIKDARKELNRFLMSREPLFEPELREELKALRLAVNEAAKTVARQDKKQSPTITARSDATEEYKKAREVATNTLTKIKTLAESNFKSYSALLQRAAGAKS